MRQAPGSNMRRCFGGLPAPGPPCRNTIGMPRALPHSSQYIEWTASSRSMPLRRGSISGKSAVMRPARSRSGNEHDRAGRLARLQVSVRLDRVLERILVVDLDLHLARLHEVE